MAHKNIKNNYDNNHIITSEQIKKNKLKKIYFIGITIILLLLIFIFMNHKDISSSIIDFKDTPKQNNISTYVEDNNDSENKIDVDLAKNKNDIDEINNFSYKINSIEKDSNPDLLKINNKYYYLFDNDILLPLDTKTWNEYIISGDAEGKYDKINEFYVTNEDNTNWTQQLTIHKVNVSDKDCFLFTDKLINGIIISISNQLESQNIDFDKNTLSFNYVSKEKDNTIMYWERKDISNLPDETQFVRVFNSMYSNNMYLITYTLKTNLNSINNDNIINNIKILNSVQELKKKDK